MGSFKSFFLVFKPLNLANRGLLLANHKLYKQLKLLITIARHENTQWSAAKANAMSLGVSVAGNIMLKKRTRFIITVFHE